MRHLRDLQAATQYRKFSSEQDLDTFLRERFPRATPEQRISMKLELEASGKFTPRSPSRRLTASLATDQPLTIGELATDRSQYRPPPPEPVYRPGMSEAERLLARLRVTAPVTLAMLEERMTQAGLDPETRIACKLEAQQRGLLKG